MRDKVVDHIMRQIEKKYGNKYDETKLLEIKYGLYGIYTILTKSVVIFLIAILLNMLNYFFIFLLFYILLRSVGYGTHAESNIKCWIISSLLMLGLPYIFNLLELGTITKIIIWALCFINFIIFCPADTEKRPMINKKRKLKFKFSIIVISLIYLLLILNFSNIANYIIAAMILEAFLTNPIGYVCMGQKIRFGKYRNRMEVK